MPPANFPEELLVHRQCQKCYTPESELKKKGKVLLVCGGCKKAVYCTKECQKSDWSYHKIFCKMNQQFRNHIRSEPAEDLKPTLNGYNPREMEHRLRNWIELNRPDLQYASVHALRLHETPSNLDTHLMLVQVNPIFKPREAGIDPKRAFSINLLQPELMSDFLPTHGGHKEAIASLMQKGRDLKKMGAVGLVMMYITVSEPIFIAHMSPWGCADVKDHGQAYDPQWRQRLLKTSSATPNFVLPISCQTKAKQIKHEDPFPFPEHYSSSSEELETDSDLD